MFIGAALQRRSIGYRRNVGVFEREQRIERCEKMDLNGQNGQYGSVPSHSMFVNIDEQDTLATGHFASVCEKLNAFGRALRESKRFYSVRTGADIRYYENGWRLEKSIEA
jgi:hypothetical protein